MGKSNSHSKVVPTAHLCGEDVRETHRESVRKGHRPCPPYAEVLTARSCGQLPRWVQPLALKAAVPKDSGLLSVEEWVVEPFAMPSF